MSTPSRLSALLLAALVATACGSSSTTSATAPATVSRCAVSVSGGDATIPAEGGTGRLTVTTARECAWTASPTASWLTIRSGTSGQGDGSLEYSAAANADPSMRRAAVEVNDQRAEIAQSAGSCTFTLGSSASSFQTAGGSGSVEVRASSAMCTWTAVSDAAWVTIRSSSSGTGNGTVLFDAQPGSPAPRTATIVVAGLRHAVTQSTGTCTFSVGPGSYAAGPGGGTSQFSVTAPAGCPWTAASNVPWVSVTGGATGSGTGAVSVRVEPTPGPARTGSMLIAGQSVTISQSPSCSYEVSPLTHTIGAAGGSATTTVTTAAGCAWSAASGAPWIVFSGPTSGSGSGVVSLGVPPATSGPRTGAVTIAGQQVTVTQDAGCAFAITPASATVDAGGGTTTVSVTAGAGCAWTAASSVSWITVSAGASGSGNGAVTLSVAASTGTTRAGTVTIAGQQFTVNQGQGCTLTLSPTTATVPAAGGSGSITVTAGSGCAWSASSPDPWITVSGAGSGTGTVQYTVASSGGASRSGTITVGGVTFTITQGSGCTFAIAPTSASVPAGGGTGNVTVTTASGCAWSASSNDAWIAITAGGSGSGTGTLAYRVDATAGGARSGSLTIAGQTFVINQANGCTFAIAPSTATAPSAGASGSVSVTAGAGCAWAASSQADWIRIASGASGSGPGTVSYTVAANTGGSRTGTLTIGGQTFTVTQDGGCAIGISPSAASAPASGGTGNVAVSAGAGCPWSASSSVPWITITAGGSGTGAGSVGYAVAANTGGSRTGTLTIGGQTFTVTQDGGCAIGIAPSTAGVPAGGGTGNVAVSAGAGCPWSASSSVPWITITAGGSGTGAGSVSYAVAANTGASRTGTLAIGGQTFTVTQDGGCSFGVAPLTFDLPSGGGTATVSVTTADGCAWAAASGADWLTVSQGSSGSGSGQVVVAVAANGGGARSGTLTIAGQTVVVNQAAAVAQCSYSVSPPSRKADTLGGTGMFNVGAGDGCGWTAESTVPWIVVVNGGNRSGGGKVDYTVMPNLTGQDRSGTISVMGELFTVEQAR